MNKDKDNMDKDRDKDKDKNNINKDQDNVEQSYETRSFNVRQRLTLLNIIYLRIV